MITSFIFFILTLLTPSVSTPEKCMSAEEKELHELINNYRISKKLPPVPISEKLNKVARAHAWDLAENFDFDPKGKCNPHSWSNKGDWTSCCYTSDHSKAECMWNKPKEIAGYESSGYEIAFYHSKLAVPAQALEGWQKSPSHNPVLLNSGTWKQVEWKAIGIGMYKNYAVVWFGETTDLTEPLFCN